MCVCGIPSQIAALEDDIQKLKEQHKNEIGKPATSYDLHVHTVYTDELLTKLQKALAHEVDDYLEARIKFLRHQVYYIYIISFFRVHCCCFLTLSSEPKGEDKNFKRYKKQTVRTCYVTKTAGE